MPPEPDIEMLYRLYGEQIYRFCLRLSRNAADAEDLTQETFVAAFRGWERFEGRSSPSTWLYRIALYRWRDQNQKGRPECVAMEESLEMADPRSNVSEAFIAQEELSQALSELPEPLLEAFLLVKAEGLKYREAAEALGIPMGTLQSRVHDAVTALRAKLRSQPPMSVEDKLETVADRKRNDR